MAVDLASVTGTGPNGRITEKDVRNAAGGDLVLQEHKVPEGRREPVRGVRRQIVEHLTRAHREVAAVTFVEECDFTGFDLTRLQTDEGLVVPVVRGCDAAPLEELAAEVARLADAARGGTLEPGELRDGTFTVTSAGKLGGVFVTPLVNHPEVGILGIHRIAPRPVVVDGEIVVRHIGNVSVTFDHRVVDGARAAAFTLDVIARLESGLPS
jgi:pyruvate dehydrogenase E2 component (dihydrolipoamide acetyltransferase)